MGARFGYDPFFAWAKQTVVVQVWRERAHYAARVQLVDEGGVSRGTRVIASDAAACAELFDAVALAISIALDAKANEPKPDEAPAPRGDSEAQGETAPEQDGDSKPAPALTTERALTTGALAPQEFPPSSSPPVSAGTVAPRRFTDDGLLSKPGPTRIDFGVDGAAVVGVAPPILPSLTVFIRGRQKAVSVALELQAAGSSEWDMPPARAASILGAAGVAPCAHLGVMALCAVGSLGAQAAWGLGLTHPLGGSALYASAGGRAAFEWVLSRRVTLRVLGTVLLDLDRATYKLDTGELAADGSPVASSWTAPPFAGSFGIGIATPID